MTLHQIALFFSILNLFLFIAVPIWAFIRLRVPGMLLAALFIWGFELLMGPAIASVAPGGLWPIFWLFWLAYGFPFSLAYVAVISGITWLIRAATRPLWEKPYGKYLPYPPDPPGKPSLGARCRLWFQRLYPIERIGILLTLAYLCALGAAASGFLKVAFGFMQ